MLICVLQLSTTVCTLTSAVRKIASVKVSSFVFQYNQFTYSYRAFLRAVFIAHFLLADAQLSVMVQMIVSKIYQQGLLINSPGVTFYISNYSLHILKYLDLTLSKSTQKYSAVKHTDTTMHTHFVR